MPPKEKLKPEDLAFNNAAVLAIQKNATERDELRKKNKNERAALYARRRASRDTGNTARSRLIGLSTLNRPFQGDGLTS